MRIFLTLAASLMFAASACAQPLASTLAGGDLDGPSAFQLASHEVFGDCDVAEGTAAVSGSNEQLSWINDVKVGYDRGFVVASVRQRDLNVEEYPFLLRMNGWGQIRHSISDWRETGQDINQFQLKRARLVFSGLAFNRDFSYFAQLDGRSSNGDTVRLLDYYVSYDVGRGQLGLQKGVFGLRAGKYKMPFTMSRWLSGREFEFSDRSVASMFFDVNRSLAWGAYGTMDCWSMPVHWEAAIFNGLVTGGAETGSSGNLDDNFAYSTRCYAYPCGEWGEGSLADFTNHRELAMRIGFGFAATEIDRFGMTEFSRLRVVDSGVTLDSILPPAASRYDVSLYALDVSMKRSGLSMTAEYYFRNVSNVRGAVVNDMFDHGFWTQIGYFLAPARLQVLSRWSRVIGNSGTLGGNDQSSDEVAGGFVWYFRRNNAKIVFDCTRINSSPVQSSALDLSAGNRGMLYRSQIQFSF